MMLRTTLLSLVSLSGLALSTPFSPSTAPHLSPRSANAACHPNFQGQNVYIVSYDAVRGAALYLHPVHNPPTIGTRIVADEPVPRRYPFRPEFDGQPDNDYIIKLGDVPANDLLMEFLAPGGRKLGVGPVDPSGDNPTFSITCRHCTGPGTPYESGQEVARKCSIVDVASGNPIRRGATWYFYAE